MKTRSGFFSPENGVLYCAALLIACLLPLSVVAQDVCIPDDTGVPYLNGNPNWWDEALGEPEYWPAADDPRWRGAFVHTSGGAAASEHVTFRTLRNADEVYMAWIVSVDPLYNDQEYVYLGLAPNGVGGAGGDVRIVIRPFGDSGSSTGEPLPAPYSVQFLTRTGPGAAWTAAAGNPDWLTPAEENIAVIRNIGEQFWAVLMRIPIDANADDGVDLATSFDFWFALLVSHPSGSVEYDYPEGLNAMTVIGSSDLAADWQGARRDLAPTAPGCIQGITLAWSDIGTVDASGDCVPATTLSADLTVDDGAGGPGSIVFCARPQNGGALVGADDIRATFRLANWGSTDRTTGTWDTINTPNCADSDVGKRACNPAAIVTGATGAITYQWDLTIAEACSYDVPAHPVNCTGEAPPTKDDHQCMLVELEGAPGITFPISSVARNMNFVQASTFVRDAEISVAGPRDVYLYVQTDNMPAPRSDQPRDNVKTGGNEPVAPATAAIAVGTGTDVAAGRETNAAHRPQQPFEPPAGVPALDKGEFEALRETEPTYQVHVFHDTGELIDVDGTQQRLLKPQPSFGYFVEHDGPLSGWRHQLGGAEEIISGRYYKLGVPASGKAVVTTTIEAVEPQVRWLWLLIGILILLLIIVLIYAKSRTGP
jgi:hypothetical protein